MYKFGTLSTNQVYKISIQFLAKREKPSQKKGKVGREEREILNQSKESKGTHALSLINTQQAEGPLVALPDFQSELIKSRADHANLSNFILKAPTPIVNKHTNPHTKDKRRMIHQI
jgi:hypothetical protein